MPILVVCGFSFYGMRSAPAGHRRLDRPGLFLTEDDHEGDLAVRCDLSLETSLPWGMESSF